MGDTVSLNACSLGAQRLGPDTQTPTTVRPQARDLHLIYPASHHNKKFLLLDNVGFSRYNYSQEVDHGRLRTIHLVWTWYDFWNHIHSCAFVLFGVMPPPLECDAVMGAIIINKVNNYLSYLGQ